MIFVLRLKNGAKAVLNHPYCLIKKLNKMTLGIKVTLYKTCIRLILAYASLAFENVTLFSYTSYTKQIQAHCATASRGTCAMLTSTGSQHRAFSLSRILNHNETFQRTLKTLFRLSDK